MANKDEYNLSAVRPTLRTKDSTYVSQFPVLPAVSGTATVTCVNPPVCVKWQFGHLLDTMTVMLSDLKQPIRIQHKVSASVSEEASTMAHIFSDIWRVTLYSFTLLHASVTVGGVMFLFVWFCLFVCLCVALLLRLHINVNSNRRVPSRTHRQQFTDYIMPVDSGRK